MSAGDDRRVLAVQVAIVAFGAPDGAAELRTTLRAGGVDAWVVATSSAAARVADLALANVGYGTAATACLYRFGDLGADWWIVANDDLVIDAAGVDRLRARLGALSDDVGLWSFTGWSEGIAPRRPSAPDERAPHGALLAVRVPVFLDIGGFDPRFFLYSEEVDLWLRLPGGVRSGHEDAPYVVHTGAVSTTLDPVARFELGRSVGVLARRHRYVLGALGRTLLTGGSLALRRRQWHAAAAFVAGCAVGIARPRTERVALRRYGAEPYERRAAVLAELRR